MEPNNPSSNDTFVSFKKWVLPELAWDFSLGNHRVQLKAA